MVLSNTPLNVCIRRFLDGAKWNAWMHLCGQLINIILINEPDRFVWKLTKSGIFMVKSMYEDLMNSHNQFPTKYLWKLKMSLKFMIFMWFLNRKVLLMRDNLIKILWKGCKKCCFFFCGCCFYMWIIWRIIYTMYNIPPPSNIKNMFGNWLNCIDKTIKAQIQIGVSTLCWSIWK
jgi:hypothetical protein